MMAQLLESFFHKTLIKSHTDKRFNFVILTFLALQSVQSAPDMESDSLTSTVTLPLSSSSQRSSLSRSWWYDISNVRGIFLVVTCINLLNYIDRGIIPGAPDEFGEFLRQTLDIPPSKESVYLGLLASSFVASYAVCAVVFGYLSTRIRYPFRLVGGGLVVWIFAVFLCGLAYQASNFYLLLFGRMLSGVGEASFQCIVPTFLEEKAPSTSKTLWMGVFFAAISMGTAIGYEYGAFWATSAVGGWKNAYFCEGVIMVPLTMVCFFVHWSPLHEQQERSEIRGHYEEFSRNHSDDESLSTLLLDTNENVNVGSNNRRNSGLDHTESFVSQFTSLTSNAMFLHIALGYAAMTGSLASLSVFGPLFMEGLEIVNKETEASFLFGVLVVFSGIIGTPLGGYLFDNRKTKNNVALNNLRAFSAKQQNTDRNWTIEDLDKANDRLRQLDALQFMYRGGALGFGFSLCSWVCLWIPALSRVGFLALFSLANIAFFSLFPIITISLLLSVPYGQRSFVLAMNTLMIHLFGDVPSPVILGAIKDHLAPHCEAVYNDQTKKMELDPRCRTEDQDGLRWTFSMPVFWIILTVISWFLAHRLAVRKLKCLTS